MINTETTNMIRTILLAAFFLCSTVVLAQDEEEQKSGGFKKENLFFGGNFGISIGSNLTQINVSPQVGYRFSKLFAAGMGINMQYLSYRDYVQGYSGKFQQGIAGLNTFARFFPIEQALIQVQPEANYLFGRFKFDSGTPESIKMDAKIVPSVLVGAGLVIPSGRGSFLAIVSYDILQDINSPYGNRPIYNFGYNINL